MRLRKFIKPKSSFQYLLGKNRKHCILRSIHDSAELPEDLESYIEDVLCGKFYEFLQDEINQQTGKDYDRAEIKVIFNQIVNSGRIS